MHVISLQSGSNGNCIFVECGEVKLLFDAGISGCRAAERLATLGRNIADVDALLISHDHVDHSRSMGIFHRKFGMPVYATAATHATACRYNIGRIDRLCCFSAGETLRFGSIAVETIPTPHDGADGVAFVIDDGRRRLGILTDLGHVFPELPEVIRTLDAVLLESNYDPTMLADGPYPAALKRRIQGPHGHLSNGEAAELLAQNASAQLRWACLAHLSEENNTPALALKTNRRVVGNRFGLSVASRYEASDVMEV